MPQKAWQILPHPPPGLSQSLSLTFFQTTLLYHRGAINPEDIKAFLSVDSRLSTDPLILPDMGKAVARIEQAVARRETVGIFGDFDVDGITATAILVLGLKNIGLTTIPYLPDRKDEGHGLNSEAVAVLRAQGTTLMITADCGTNSSMEIELGSSLGMDTVVTDHHTVQESFAGAVAVINPQREDSHVRDSVLTGAGLAYKLVEAVYSSLGKSLPDDLVGLAALGTVADVGPLQKENRFIVKRGLEALSHTKRPGIQALISKSRQTKDSLNTETLSFWLIPRLNAAGRLGDAKLSLDLLTTDSPSTAERIADELNEINAKRREISDEAYLQASEQILQSGPELPLVLMVENENWVPGVLGLIAGRLAEEYYRPVIAATNDKDICRASARSIPEFNISAALEENEELLLRFGGHPMAAGFSASLRNLPTLMKSITERAEKQLNPSELVPSIKIDAEIGPSEVSGNNFKFIKRLEPFGAGNPEPIFLNRGAQVISARMVGADKRHTQMQIDCDGTWWNAIAFHQDHNLKPGDQIDIVYKMTLNEW
ncbi:MAG: single-stranded-DNA-specific exonuclease RecJ, partial [SAR202 cluster bacterium]|nr:single-stranded-DNA-specific exonuclease RecJ [SAR202 cluster bacterium]